MEVTNVTTCFAAKQRISCGQRSAGWWLGGKLRRPCSDDWAKPQIGPCDWPIGEVVCSAASELAAWTRLRQRNWPSGVSIAARTSEPQNRNPAEIALGWVLSCSKQTTFPVEAGVSNLLSAEDGQPQFTQLFGDVRIQNQGLVNSPPAQTTPLNFPDGFSAVLTG